MKTYRVLRCMAIDKNKEEKKKRYYGVAKFREEEDAKKFVEERMLMKELYRIEEC